MPQVDKYAVGANFISEYYYIFCTRPRDLARLYTANADLRHGEGREGIGKGKDAVNLLCTKYPGENRGKVVVNEMEILPSNNPRVVNVRVRGVFTTTATQAVQGFTQVFELHEHGDSNYFGITNDVMSWSAVETNQATHTAPAPAAASKVPPPPTLAADDWANETPPLFAKADPKTEISPMEQPLAAAAKAPAAELEPKPKQAPKAKHVDAAAEPKPAADEPARKRTAAEIARDGKKADDKKPKEEPKQAEPKKEEPKKEEAPAPKKEEKKEEPKVEATKEAETPKDEADVDLSKMSMLERIRYKQNIKEKPIEEKKPKEEPKKEEPKKEKTAEEKKREGDRRREAGEKKKAEAAKKEGEKKKEGDAKKDGDAKKSGSGERKEGGKGEKSNSVVYYDLILKGLPKGTTVDELYPLLDPYVTAQRPIKLEAKPDKNDNNTIRTFAFVALTNKGKYKTADEAVPALKKAKLTLGGTNVIVDRVREKFEK